MTIGCVTNGSFTSGSTLSGLAYVQGSTGTSYFVTSTANATSGYAASAPSAVGGPHADTSQLNAPGTPDRRGVDDDRGRGDGHVHRVERRRSRQLHRDRLH